MPGIVSSGRSGKAVGILIERPTSADIVSGGYNNVLLDEDPTSGVTVTRLYEHPVSFKGERDDFITIPEGYGGLYHVSLSFEWERDTPAVGMRQCVVVIGSNSVSADTQPIITKVPAVAGFDDKMIATRMVLLDDGATLTPQGSQNSGQSLGVDTVNFQAIRVGDG